MLPSLKNVMVDAGKMGGGGGDRGFHNGSPIAERTCFKSSSHPVHHVTNIFQLDLSEPRTKVIS
jgi:hypothetical protein